MPRPLDTFQQESGRVQWVSTALNQTPPLETYCSSVG